MTDDFRFMQWFAGQIDGDGSIGVKTAAQHPFVAIQKAEKGRHSLQRIVERVGGSLYQSGKQTGRTQAKHTWMVRGPAAVALAARLRPYLKLKQRQARAVGSWTSKLGRWWVETGGVTRTGVTREEAAAVVGRCTVTVTKYARLGRSCNGHGVGREAGNGEAVLSEVRALRGVPDEPVGRLHPSYAAGFFDAEGCVALKRSSCLYVTVAQKDPAVLRALQAQWGGSVIKEKNRENWCWTLCGQSSKAFLAVIRADVHEKREQVELALQVNPANWRELAPRMKALRGCQL